VKRIVIRPRIQIPLLVLAFGIFGLLGVTMWTDPEILAKRDWFGIILGVVLTIVGVLGIWRTLRLGVVIDEDGIRIRGLGGRDRVTPWQRVREIQCDKIDARAGMPIYGPVIHLDDDNKLPVRPLGSYSRSAAEQKVAQLRAFIAESPSA
jgi:Bacterial PH domain